jgi:hypothetical protein
MAKKTQFQNCPWCLAQVMIVIETHHNLTLFPLKLLLFGCGLLVYQTLVKGLFDS